MSAPTDSIPLRADAVADPRPALARTRAERDLQLVARVASGDPAAVEQLAERLALRAQRVARALMDGSDDASDAALHAVIEALRAHGNFRGQLRLERWGDRVMALSVVRFARAVRRRDAAGARKTPDPSLAARSDERSARTFEQYLTMLSETNRQTLLLRHALGFALGELADALQCSLPMAREQLQVARRELRSLVRRKGDGAAQVLGEGAERWCTLRDREALGGMLTPDELEEVSRLETRDAEVWAFVAQVRALELFFDASRDDPDPAPEHELAARAVAALEVTSPTQRNRAIAPGPDEDTGPNFDGSRTVRRFAIGASIALAAASAIALWRYEPQPMPLGSTPSPKLALPPANVPEPVGERPAEPAPEPPALRAPAEPHGSSPRPTVESMSTARTATRGAKLLSKGRLLNAGVLLSQGDTVEAGERAGCLRIEPDSEVCLAPQSKLTLHSLLASERRVALLTGRAVLRVGAQSEASRWTMRIGEVDVTASRGVFAAERAADGKQYRVRTLRAPVDVHAGDVSYALAEDHAATMRPDGVAREISPLAPLQAERDWELLATDLYPNAVAAPASPRTPGLSAKSNAAAAVAGAEATAKLNALAAAAEEPVAPPQQPLSELPSGLEVPEDDVPPPVLEPEAKARAGGRHGSGGRTKRGVEKEPADESGGEASEEVEAAPETASPADSAKP